MGAFVDPRLGAAVTSRAPRLLWAQPSPGWIWCLGLAVLSRAVPGRGYSAQKAAIAVQVMFKKSGLRRICFLTL